MRLVIIESPLHGNFERNITYARLALLDCILRGESPIASHLLYTQILDDSISEERKLGMKLGYEWYRAASLIAFYIDFGMSPGMHEAKKHVIQHHLKYELRHLSDGALLSETPNAPHQQLQHP